MCDRSTFDILKFGPSTLITETKWISIYDTIVMQFNEFEVKKRKKKFIKAIFFELENKWYNYLSLESILVYLDRFLHLKIVSLNTSTFPPLCFYFSPEVSVKLHFQTVSYTRVKFLKRARTTFSPVGIFAAACISAIRWKLRRNFLPSPSPHNLFWKVIKSIAEFTNFSLQFFFLRNF